MSGENGAPTFIDETRYYTEEEWQQLVERLRATRKRAVTLAEHFADLTADDAGEWPPTERRSD